MATFTISNHKVFPTENDIQGGQGIGAGRTLTESNLITLGSGFVRPGVVLSGFALPSSGAATQNYTGGTAVIQGYLVVGTGVTSVTITGTQEVWIQITQSSGKATGVQYLTQAVGAARPDRAVLLGTVTESGGTISSSTDYRSWVRDFVQGSYTGTDGAQNITTGQDGRPSVVVIRNTGSGRFHLSFRILDNNYIGIAGVSSTLTVYYNDSASIAQPFVGGFTVSGSGANDLSRSADTYHYMSFQ